MRRHYRQGDVFLVQASGLPKGAREVEPENGRVVLAHGEVTGHHHSLPAVGVKLWECTDSPDRYLEVEEPASLVHQEHAEIPLPIGTYRVVQQREYSPEEIRRVKD